MDIPEEFVLVTIFDPGLPSFVSGEVEYLGSKAVAGRVNEGGIRVPKRLVFKGKREQVHRHWQHSHENCWGVPYKLKASLMRVECYYFKLEREYVRAIQFNFHGLKYLSDASKQWEPINAEDCWGNDGVLAGDEPGDIYNALLMIDRRFKMLADVKADMADPQPFDYKQFFNEVFADE